MRKLPAWIKKGVYMAVFATGVWMLANPVLSNTLPSERVIHLKGTTNTRDIGGYQSGDLSTVRGGQIIRSDKLSGLTANDRSGVGVALILEALDVDRDTIMEEYLLTNEISRIEEKAVFLSKESKNASRGNKFSKGTPASSWLPIVGVDAKMLEAFYASVDEKYGSMDAFLTELGVDQDARHALVASLTTEQLQLVMGD